MSKKKAHGEQQLLPPLHTVVMGLRPSKEVERVQSTAMDVSLCLDRQAKGRGACLPEEIEGGKSSSRLRRGPRSTPLGSRVKSASHTGFVTFYTGSVHVWCKVRSASLISVCALLCCSLTTDNNSCLDIFQFFKGSFQFSTYVTE